MTDHSSSEHKPDEQQSTEQPSADKLYRSWTSPKRGRKAGTTWLTTIAAVITAIALLGAGVMIGRVTAAPAQAGPPQQEEPRYEAKVLPAVGDTDAVLSIQQPAGPDKAAHSCTATLIKPQWAVTAAHCVTTQPESIKRGKEQYRQDVCSSVDLDKRPKDPVAPETAPRTVRGGTKIYSRGGESATVTAVKAVPGWNWGIGSGAMKDLALLQLDHAMKIPPAPLATSAPSAYSNMLAAGWATWPDRCGGIIPEMQQWDLKAARCPTGDTEGHICGTTGGKAGPCEGVSGGPLFTKPGTGPGAEPRKLIGVYSHVPGGSYCGEVVVVYTLLADYMDFIDATTGA